VKVLEKCQAALDQAQPVRGIDFSKEELVVLKPLCLITAKPAMFVGNVSRDRLREQPLPGPPEGLRREAERAGGGHLRQDRGRTGRHGRRGPRMFLAEMGQDEPGLNRLIRAAFKLLGLQTYFTAGVKEVRAWTIHVGDTAPQAAGVIHTDFERGFIRAQTIAYDDFIKFGENRAPRTPARCAPKARSTSSRTATC
jgi:ribosome-binding ATPase YchF (GTP1/OBG family)